MSGGALPGVGRTAVWVAGMRAGEGARADPLFDDPFAGVFVAAAGAGVAPDLAAMPPGTAEFLAVRTRFFDDQVRTACAAGIGQLVLLAAGLDCRAFRLDWPGGARLFELDLPDVFAFKEPVLVSVDAVARCARVVVGVDLRTGWTGALSAAGFDPGAATGWLAEGLLPYLQAEERERFLAMVTGLSAPGSRLMFDYHEPTAAERPAMRAMSDAAREMGAELVPTVDSPPQWLVEHGWQAEFFRVPALGEYYGRPLPAGVDLVASNAIVLTAASR